jgi:hypothetical protein
MWRSYYTAGAGGSFNGNTGMFVALRATTTDGLQGDEAFLTANYGHRFVPPRDSVIALEVPWLLEGECR